MALNKLYLGTNLKMYKTNSETLSYLRELVSLTADLERERLQLFVIPSFPALADASRETDRASLLLGAQNMHWAESGQYTGEVSPRMLQEIGMDIIELGHSERRHVFDESDEFIRLKTHSAVEHGFITLLCVGETAEEKAAGQADEVLRRQLVSAFTDLPEGSASKLWVAYEPVWAIGVNGQPAPADYVAERHAAIRSVLRELFGTAGKEIPILYGGSVNLENAPGYIVLPNIDGLFVGRTAWEAPRFRTLMDLVIPLWQEKK